MSQRPRVGTQSPKVLVVDDHEISLRSTVAALRETVGSVKQARTLSEARALAFEWLPDAIFTDLDLDGGSGLDLIRAIREQWPADRPQPEIVAMSGDSGPAVATALAELGVHRTLTKPIEPGELPSTLRPQSRRAAASQSGTDMAGLFDQELRRQLPQLDRFIALRDLQGATRILHQLVASSAICGNRGLERRLRKLYTACQNEVPIADLASAYFSALRAVSELGPAGTQLRDSREE